MSHILLIPSMRPMDGSGHLQRMVRVHRQLPGSQLYIRSEDREAFARLVPDSDGFQLVSDVLNPALIIIDMPWLERETMRQLLRRAPVVGIDLGGGARAMASYLVDTLPYPGDALHRRYFAEPERTPSTVAEIMKIPGGRRTWEAPNLFDPGFLPLPKRTREPDGRIERVLVSFGGSDPADLTGTFLAALERSPRLRGVGGSIIVPPRREGDLPPVPGNWQLLPYTDDLPERYAEYDLVVCSYGLTPWEAQYAGVKTLVVDASFYHGELARRSGFISIGPDSLVQVADELTDPAFLLRLSNQASRVRTLEPKPLAGFLQTLERHCGHRCPVCGEFPGHTLVCRNESRSYFRCGSCSTIFQVRLLPDTIEYDRAYFFEEYRSQYGRTYLEDFEHIKDMGRRRLEMINRQLFDTEGQPRLLDIGCAYGPFLDAARDGGFLPEGIDISADAVGHVRNSLGISARCGDIADEDFRNGYDASSFDVVTMWYVIEHFRDLTAILPWIRRILKPWGLFAIATPNSSGISGRRNLPGFLFGGPEDHFTVWSPRQAEKAGAFHGFQLQHWNSTGHHGERFPGILGKAPFKGLSTLLSRAASLGDTFEAVFIRLPDEQEGPPGERPDDANEN
jgi:2-polyprenyl-3-methyl-5-hydroxy-6-metoxy-1,4-benzoquinol methylase